MTTKKGIAFLFIALSMLLVGEGKALSAVDKAQIKAVILRWYELSHEASINGGDVSKFPEVLVDTPNYPLDAEHRKYIADILGSNAVQGAGLLTAMQAQYKNLGEGWALLKIAINKAKQENRDVSPVEMDEIVKQMHGEIPPIVDESDLKPTLTFESFDLTLEGKVVVRFSNGIIHDRYILIKVADQWFISSAKTVKVDF